MCTEERERERERGKKFVTTINEHKRLQKFKHNKSLFAKSSKKTINKKWFRKIKNRKEYEEKKIIGRTENNKTKKRKKESIN